MNILDKIIAHKKREIVQQQQITKIEELKQTEHFNRKTLSLTDFLLRKNKSGIIAEFKRKSPSKGFINASADVQTVTKTYSLAGSSGISVLTDYEFFGGNNQDLLKTREVNKTPILRKDFIISEYQIYEAKSIGADVILLIAAALNPDELKHFTKLAHTLGLEVLLEIHSEEDLQPAIAAQPDLIGVNNRNLKTFKTSLDVSRKLISQIPENIMAVSESGISDPTSIMELKKLGYKGFLIGENFMRTADPGKAAAEFMQQLSKLETHA